MSQVFAFALLGLTSCLPDKLVRVRQGRTNYLAPSAAEDSLDRYNNLDNNNNNNLDRYNNQASSSTGYAARSLPAPEPIAIRSQSFEPEASGAFRFAYEGENEVKQKAEGSLKTVGEAEVVVMKGEYSYIGEDGNEWKVWVHASQKMTPALKPALCQHVARWNGLLTRLVSTQVPPSSPSRWSPTTRRWRRR